MSSRRLQRGMVGAAALLLAGNALAADVTRPVLLELFTSQGCSSCPPADRELEELGARDDVLALAFHIDYWDSLGWVDPFASPAWSERQRAYAALRGFRIYTPQLVVDGRRDVVGSAHGDALAAIARAHGESRAAPASIHRQEAGISITVGTIPGAREARGRLLLVSFDGRRSTAIQHGENRGRELVSTHTVRSLRVVGDWRNEPLTLQEALREGERGEHLALIVQSDDGMVWALASTR